MAAEKATTCAACGASGELHQHHLVPRVVGGATLPTVPLCIRCHGEVHGRSQSKPFSTDHRELTAAGLRRARALGKKLGNPYGEAAFGAAIEAAKAARRAANKAAVSAEKARELADRLAMIADQLEKRARQIPASRRRISQAAAEARRDVARAKAREVAPYLRAAEKAGCVTLQDKADALNARGIATPSGKGQWVPETVRRIEIIARASA